MDEAVVKEIVDEILSSIEPLETQSAAVLHFMKAKGLATDEDLAPFLEQAGNAANVRWRAVRVRVDALISNAMKVVDEEAENKPEESAAAKPEPEASAPEASTKERSESAAGLAPSNSRGEEKDSFAKSTDSEPSELDKSDNLSQSGTVGAEKQTSGKPRAA